MEWKNEIATKIKLLANRVRCSNCNANSSEALFIIDDGVSLHSLIRVPPCHSRNPPMFRSRKHLKINRVQQVKNIDVLVRICLRCGTSRRIGMISNIPNI